MAHCVGPAPADWCNCRCLQDLVNAQQPSPDDVALRYVGGLQDPDGFVAASEAEQEALRQQLRKAQEALPDVAIDREASLCSALCCLHAAYCNAGDPPGDES